MTARLPRALFATILLALLAGLLTGVGAGSAAAYSPPSGVTTSNPLGVQAERRTIIAMVIRSIDAAPRRSQIRVASWNIRSNDVVESLVRAHRRGVGVRVIMDVGNANAENPNLGIDQLTAALSGRENRARPGRLRSGVRLCVSSCRGVQGIPHAKFLLFSRLGASRKVVINTSANVTDLAASSQWNDAFVLKRKPAVYRSFRRIFSQMWQDQPVAQGYTLTKDGSLTAMFYPYTGVHSVKDPIVRELDRVRCVNATGSRITKIRVAMTSWYGERGVAIAQKIRDLANQGCDVRIVYAVMGNEALRVLRRLGPAPVPLQQIVQDFDGDGVYDRYLHSKVLTIKGTYQRRQAAVTINGSANWSPAVLASDEAVLRLRGTKVLNTYNRWIDGLYDAPPVNAPLMLSRRGTFGPIDAYAKIQEN
ncbi:MAG: phospholipase D-like domain-containing protein [Nocardioides sp.]|nr:phospholipase D-like domain-containing protein [Nocardioides sp.]